MGGWVLGEFPVEVGDWKLTLRRGDFENQHGFDEYLRGYRVVRAFFDEHM